MATQRGVGKYFVNGVHGTVAITGGGTGLTYDPAQLYVGSDTFTYTVSDGVHVSAPATVSITVDPVNDAPTATDGTRTTDEDAPVALLPHEDNTETWYYGKGHAR